MSRRHRVKKNAEPQFGPNRPCAQGAEIGESLARIYDVAVAANQGRAFAEPCKTCAYRRGTVPNRCLETVMDATKSTVEGRRFMCHQSFDRAGEPTETCAGWLLTQTIPMPIATVPWDYAPVSPPDPSAPIAIARALASEPKELESVG